MQKLASDVLRIFWCPRCGTLTEESGDFSRTEMPANMRAVITAAKLKPGEPYTVQQSRVQATFVVDVTNDQHPKVELRIIDDTGRRVW
jgi:hypothetical protein